MGHPSRDSDRTGRGVDLVAVQRSVEQLMAGIEPVAPGRGARVVADGLTALINAAQPILGVDRIGVMLLDENDRLRSVASSDPLAATVEREQENTGVGPGVDTMRSRQTVTVTDLFADGRYPQLAGLLEEPAARAVVSAPIWVDRRLAGNFNAIRARPHQWQPQEIAAVETYARVVGTLLQFDAAALRELSPSEGGGSSLPVTRGQWKVS